jgi:hypothetical protein
MPVIRREFVRTSRVAANAKSIKGTHLSFLLWPHNVDQLPVQFTCRVTNGTQVSPTLIQVSFVEVFLFGGYLKENSEREADIGEVRPPAIYWEGV